MRSFLRSVWETGDFPAAVLFGLILITSGWLVLLPFNRSIQQTSLKRFHLATPNYLAWAIQQPIPAMYNFENQYWLSNKPLMDDQFDLSPKEFQTGEGEEKIESSYANHFPARIVTFGDGRFTHLRETKSTRYLSLQSRYRQEGLRTAMVLEPQATGGFRMTREDLPYE